MKPLVLALSAIVLASCASVPPDAGLSDVQQAVVSRSGQPLEWSADQERVRSMLADELTADEAVAIAVANNPRLQVTMAELGVARAELMEASTIANPLFEFEMRFPAEPFHPYELRLAQSLFDLIQLPRRRAIGRLAFDAAKLDVTSNVLRFATDVRAAYYDAVAATQHAEMSRTIVAAAQAAADVALRQHAAENITDLDLENEQALYERARLELSRAERQLLVAREALLRMLGVPDASFTVPARFPDLPESELDQPRLEELAAAQRLDIALAQSRLEIAKRRVPVARLEALGEGEIDVHYEREPDGAHTVGPGIEVPIPIFNTGLAAKTRAEAELLSAREMLNALNAESSSQLRTAGAVVAEARARVEYYRDVVLPRRRRIVELTKLEHNAMLAGVFQLLQARQGEAEAQRDFIEAQREYWSARTALDRALQGIAGDGSFESAPDWGRGRQANVSRGGH